MAKISVFRRNTLRVPIAITSLLGFHFLGWMTSPAAHAGTEPGLDALFAEAAVVREPASELPEPYRTEFQILAPEREPSSVKKKSRRAKAPNGTAHSRLAQQKTANATGAAPVTPVAPARRSRLPKSIVNGFELRVHYNRVTSMFWVVERDKKFDLIYANSTGTKSLLGLSPESFKRLQETARSIQLSEVNPASCKTGSMQLHSVSPQQPERSITACVESKTASAETLRNFSQSLAVLLR